ncbi:MAG: RNA helicase [endosymbiont of Galathealinum brachiosum]|uniref:RNA helicase n=1 Tax=endosymbiont of Galathealinum brachiosum TaxID=2200906 RepID=A0A370DGR3_9GAMM|nr:MAG: RNA helicase [endosymbiont of Galathealinum brachiosum]
MNFSSLDLAPEIQKAVDACGYRQMTDIQKQAIVPARRGMDLLANAQTGTGKTAAFAIPILQQMLDRPKETVSEYPRTLILTPTRELAEQLAETIKSYAQFTSLSVMAMYGGVKLSGQQKKLHAGIDILVSTPGRLLEHLVQCNVHLSQVEFVVLDEADRMLDMGFISDVQTLLKQTPDKRQTLLFSATMSKQVDMMASSLLTKHKVVSAAKKNETAVTVEHVVYAIEEHRKADLFLELIEQENWFKVLVFTSTKAQADELKRQLKHAKITSALCHGDKSQGARRRAIADFKSDKVQVLIATEVAARGLDIQGLEYVVNYNLPYLAEDYVHRIGRTGRAGEAGHAISFVSREEERALNNIERLIGYRIKRLTMPGFDVGSRDSLLKNISKNVRPGRTNKATQTKIKRGKNKK